MSTARVINSDEDLREERRRETTSQQTVAYIATALIITGKFDVNEADGAVAKAQELARKAGLNP